MSRNIHQDLLQNMVKDVFGANYFFDTSQRVYNIVEKSVALAWSEGVQKRTLYAIVDYVCNGIKDDPVQELGYVSIELLLYASNKNLSLESIELKQIVNLGRMPLNTQINKYNSKAELGIAPSHPENAQIYSDYDKLEEKYNNLHRLASKLIETKKSINPEISPTSANQQQQLEKDFTELAALLDSQ